MRDGLVSLSSQQASLKMALVALDAAHKNAAEIAELYRQGLSNALQVADANVRLFEAEVEVARQRNGLALALLNLRAAQGLDPFGKEPTDMRLKKTYSALAAPGGPAARSRRLRKKDAAAARQGRRSPGAWTCSSRWRQ